MVAAEAEDADWETAGKAAECSEEAASTAVEGCKAEAQTETVPRAMAVLAEAATARATVVLRAGAWAVEVCREEGWAAAKAEHRRVRRSDDTRTLPNRTARHHRRYSADTDIRTWSTAPRCTMRSAGAARLRCMAAMAGEEDPAVRMEARAVGTQEAAATAEAQTAGGLSVTDAAAAATTAVDSTEADGRAAAGSVVEPTGAAIAESGARAAVHTAVTRAVPAETAEAGVVRSVGTTASGMLGLEHWGALVAMGAEDTAPGHTATAAGPKETAETARWDRPEGGARAIRMAVVVEAGAPVATADSRTRTPS